MNEAEKELIALRLWKEDALEASADHNRAYAAQGEMLKEMHGVIGKVADALHSAQLCLNGYVEIKEHFLPRTKKRKTKVSNVKVRGRPLLGDPSSPPG